MVEVETTQESKDQQGNRKDHLLYFRPSHGDSTKTFLFKLAYNRENERLRSLKEIYNLSFFEEKLEDLKRENGQYPPQLAEDLIKWMKIENVYVHDVFTNDENDIRWIRTIRIQDYFKINLELDAMTRAEEALQKKTNVLVRPYEEDPEITNEITRLYMKELAIQDEFPFKHDYILHLVRTELKEQLLHTLVKYIKSPSMEEFHINFQRDSEKADKMNKPTNMVENYFYYLYIMCRAVAVFDFVKAKVLENYAGKARDQIKEAKTWNSFISVLKGWKKGMLAHEAFREKFYPAVIDEDKFNRELRNATSKSELVQIASNRLDGLIRLREEFASTYGPQYLMFFILHDQISTIRAIFNSVRQFSFKVYENKDLAHLLIPRSPVELMEEAEGGDGLEFLKQLAAFNDLVLRGAIDEDHFNSKFGGERLRPSYFISEPIKQHDQPSRESDQMEAKPHARKTLSKHENQILKGLNSKIVDLDRYPDRTIVLSKKELNVVENYRNDPIGIWTFDYLEQGRFLKPKNA